MSFLAIEFEVSKMQNGTGTVTDILLVKTDKGWTVKHQDRRWYYMCHTGTGQTIVEALSKSQFQPNEPGFLYITRGLYEKYEYEDRLSGNPDNWGKRTGYWDLFRLDITPNNIICDGRVLAPPEDVKDPKILENLIDSFIAEGLDKET